MGIIKIKYCVKSSPTESRSELATFVVPVSSYGTGNTIVNKHEQCSGAADDKKLL